MAHDHIEKTSWDLRTPLQMEALRRRIEDPAAAEALLDKLRRQRARLDAVVYALSNRALSPERRHHLTGMLERARAELELCLEALGIPPQARGHDPLWHYHQLDPVARSHLAAILGVPEEPAFYPVLDVKAQEYLAQVRAFESIAGEEGFDDSATLARETGRGALALTLSGSLIVVSEPDERGARRYLYQNIYGNAHPPEGLLMLEREIRVGRRIRSLELTTSPVRILRVARRALSWEAQSRAFARISTTISSLVGSSPPLADPSERTPLPGGKEPRASRALVEVLHREQEEAWERFDALAEAFAGGTADAADDAETLALCHELQTAARQLGLPAHPVEEVHGFVTDDGYTYALDPRHPTRITRLSRSGRGPDVVLVRAAAGRQLVTAGAPLAFVGGDGTLLELTAPVAKIKVTA